MAVIPVRECRRHKELGLQRVTSSGCWQSPSYPFALMDDHLASFGSFRSLLGLTTEGQSSDGSKKEGCRQRFDNPSISGEVKLLKGLMTPRDLPTGTVRIMTTAIKVMAVVIGVLGVGLVLSSVAYFVIQPRTASGFDQIRWVLGCLKVPWLWVITPLLVLALGLVLVRTALLPWNRWSAGAIEQVIAAVLFFPSLWWVWNVIQVVPDQAWGWRFLGVGAAVLCLAAHRVITAAVCRVLFRGDDASPPPILKVSPAS